MISWRWMSGLIVLASLGGCAATPGNEMGSTKLSAQIYYSAGQLAENQNDWPRAIAEYRLAISAKGPHAPAIYSLAMAYTHLKDYDRATQTWKQYVSATDGAAMAYGDLAHGYELAGKFTEAKQAYEQALGKGPDNPTCRVNYGLMLARQGKIAEATDELRGILTDAEIHYDLGVVYEEQKKIAPARAEYAQAIKLDPHLTQAKARLARLESVTAAAK